MTTANALAPPTAAVNAPLRSISPSTRWHASGPSDPAAVHVGDAVPDGSVSRERCRRLYVLRSRGSMAMFWRDKTRPKPSKPNLPMAHPRLASSKRASSPQDFLSRHGVVEGD